MFHFVKYIILQRCISRSVSLACITLPREKFSPVIFQRSKDQEDSSRGNREREKRIPELRTEGKNSDVHDK